MTIRRNSVAAFFQLMLGIRGPVGFRSTGAGGVSVVGGETAVSGIPRFYKNAPEAQQPAPLPGVKARAPGMLPASHYPRAESSPASLVERGGRWMCSGGAAIQN